MIDIFIHLYIFIHLFIYIVTHENDPRLLGVIHQYVKWSLLSLFDEIIFVTKELQFFSFFYYLRLSI